MVDDSPTVRYVLVSWLRRDGHHVVEAATGAEALSQLQTQPVDVVVLDVALPDIDGFEVCEQIKSQTATAALPVIHVSAVYVDVSDRTRGLTRGADAYLVEPVDPDELVATLHAVLRRYRARQRAERKATRLARLVELTAVLNAAKNFVACLRAAAQGTARIFEGPALVTAPTPDGQVRTAQVNGMSETAITFAGKASGGSLLDAVGADTAVRAQPRDAWPAFAGAVPAADVWTVTVPQQAECPPVFIAVCAADFVDDDDAPALRQWGQAVSLALRGTRPRGEHVGRAPGGPVGGQPPPTAANWAPLTRREREIAVLIAAGHTNRKIAHLLVIAKRTVDAHVERILAKLDFGSRAQVAAWVAERRSTDR